MGDKKWWVRSAVKAFPVKSLAVTKALAREDACPKCGSELDTGWECNSCGFDAQPLIQTARLK